MLDRLKAFKGKIDARSVQPEIMPREEIISTLRALSGDIPENFRRRFRLVSLPVKVIAALSDRTDLILGLSGAEQQKLTELSAIAADDTKWGKLSPVQQLELREALTPLVRRKFINL